MTDAAIASRAATAAVRTRPPRSPAPVEIPALHGLRGAAVLTIVLYDLDLGWLNDGPLLAIEVLFVVFGYLITTGFIRQRQRSGGTGRVALVRMWSRRAQRVLPTIGGLLAFVGVYVLLFNPPAMARKYRGDGLAAVVGLGNWWSIASPQPRFTTPFLLSHLWPLAIGAQLLAVFGSMMWLAARTRQPLSRAWPWFTGIGALLSAVWMSVLTIAGNAAGKGDWPLGINPFAFPPWLRTLVNFTPAADRSRVYFGTDTRAQGLLVGATLAFVLARVDVAWFTTRRAHLLTAIGSISLVSLIVFTPYQAGYLFHGGFLLADVLTAITVAGLVAPARTGLSRVLSLAPIVSLGRIAFALYVWHIPVFATFNPLTTHLDDLPLHLVRVIATFAVAAAWWRFVDRPIVLRLSRDKRPRRRRKLIARRRDARAAGFALGGAMVLLAGTSFTASRTPSAAELPPNNPDGRPVVLFAGDSMAYGLGLTAGGEGIDQPQGFHAVLAAQSGCGIGTGDLIRNGVGESRYAGCVDWRSLWRRQVDAEVPSTSVVLAWGWELYDRQVPNPNGTTRVVAEGSAEWVASMRRDIQDGIDILASRGGTVLLLTMPCIDKNGNFRNKPASEATDRRRVDAMNDLIRAVAAANTETTSVFNLHAYLCPGGDRYQVEIDGEVTSDDGVHFTTEGARKVWESWLAPKLQAKYGLPG